MSLYILLLLSLTGLYYFYKSTLLVLLSECLIMYISAILIERIKSRYLLLFLVCLNILPLLLVRFQIFGIGAVGIAFATLKALSYIIDVYRGKYNASKNLIYPSFYLLFLPLVILGPVIRYDNVMHMAKNREKLDIDILVNGIFMISVGFFMKLVIANRLVPFKEKIVSEHMTGIAVLMMLLIYSVELYMDFYGGIKVVMGVCALCGFSKLPKNFDEPYKSRSLSEFWRRWHISMSEWFKDYVFYPLSTSVTLKSVFKKIFPKANNRKINTDVFIVGLIITWILTGMWHGFDSRYIVWGFLNGLILCVEIVLRNKNIKINNPVTACTLTYILVSLLRVFDCYDNTKVAFVKLASIITISAADFIKAIGFFDASIIVALCSLVLFIMSEKIFKTFKGKCIGMILYITLALLLGRYGFDYNAFEFIYGNF